MILPLRLKKMKHRYIQRRLKSAAEETSPKQLLKWKHHGLKRIHSLPSSILPGLPGVLIGGPRPCILVSGKRNSLILHDIALPQNIISFSPLSMSLAEHMILTIVKAEELEKKCDGYSPGSQLREIDGFIYFDHFGMKIGQIPSKMPQITFHKQFGMEYPSEVDKPSLIRLKSISSSNSTGPID